MLALLLTLLFAQAHCHGILEAPAPRNGATIAGDNKGRNVGPCGRNAQAQKGAVVKTYQAGDQVQVSWRTAIPHGGIARISISRQDGANEPNDFEANALTADIPCCTARETETAQVTIPADFAECESCTLQWFWAGDSDYFDCSDISVNAAPPPPVADPSMGNGGNGGDGGQLIQDATSLPVDYSGGYPIQEGLNMIPDGEGGNPGVCCQLDAGAVVISDPQDGVSVTAEMSAKVLDCELMPEHVTEIAGSAILTAVDGFNNPTFLGPIDLSAPGRESELPQEFLLGVYIDEVSGKKKAQWRNRDPGKSWIICNGVAEHDPNYASFGSMATTAIIVGVLGLCCCCGMLMLFCKLKSSANKKGGRYPPGAMQAAPLGPGGPGMRPGPGTGMRPGPGPGMRPGPGPMMPGPMGMNPRGQC